MSLNLEGRSYDSPVSGDAPLRVPSVGRGVYRQQGIVASLASAAAAHLVDWQLRRKRRWGSGASPPVPDHLREDIGLPPAPQRLPDWWELWRR